MGQSILFQGYRVIPELNRVVLPTTAHEAEGHIQLEPKIMDVLVCLIQANREVISREQILTEVWGETVVGDDVLTRAIGQLRKTFGDDPRQPTFIATIPRRGYRFLVECKTENGGLEALTDSTGPISAPPNTSRRRKMLWVPLLAVFFVLAVLFTLPLVQQHYAVADRVVRAAHVFPVTSIAGVEIDPTVNPDGTMVAYSARRVAGEPVNIFIQDLSTGDTRQLSFDTTNARHPTWSPDGRTIAYISEGDPCSVCLISVEGGMREVVAVCGHDQEHDPDWTADGLGLVMVVQDEPGAPAHLSVLDLATGDLSPLTNPDSDHVGDFGPAVAPDGELVAFSRERASGAQDIYVVPLAGGEPVRLTFDSRGLTGMDWSEDGQYIIYSSERAGMYGLWRVAVAGGLPQFVMGSGDKIKDPATAGNRNLVVYENWLYDTNIWRMPLTADSAQSDGRVQPLVGSNQWDLQPSYSPDGQALAFVSTRSEGAQIWVAEADGTRPRKLTQMAEVRVGSPSWSPDSVRLVFTAMNNGQTDLFVMPVDGGREFRLTDHELDELAPSWSADGTSIYFASRRSDSWQVWQISVADQRLVQVTQDGGFAARESLDGQYLYFTKATENGIWQQLATGGSVVKVVDQLSTHDWGNWTVTPDGLIFVDRTGTNGPQMARWENQTRQVTYLAAADSMVGQGISLSPDGRQLAYSRFDRAECDLIAAEGLHQVP